MCTLNERIWTRAIPLMGVVVFFALIDRGGHCAERRSSDPPTKKGSEITAFKLSGKAIQTRFTIVYSSPYKWRSEESIEGLFKIISICDGNTAWEFSIENSQITDIKRWNAKKAVEKHGAKLAFERLMMHKNMIIVYALVNPYHPRWKKELSFPMYDFYKTIKTRVERLGRTSCAVYETGENLKTVMWFGVEDGLLRKEIISDRGFNVEEIVVDKVTINPRLDDDLFRFTPPPSAKVIDKTDELFKEIDEQQDMYKMRSQKEEKSQKKPKREK